MLLTLKSNWNTLLDKLLGRYSNNPFAVRMNEIFHDTKDVNIIYRPKHNVVKVSMKIKEAAVVRKLVMSLPVPVECEGNDIYTFDIHVDNFQPLSLKAFLHTCLRGKYLKVTNISLDELPDIKGEEYNPNKFFNLNKSCYYSYFNI